MDYNLADLFFESDVLEGLKRAGLKVVVSHDEFCDSPREWGDHKSTWVGVDAPTQTDIVDTGACFDDYVRNYCRQILGCTPNDIVWSTVYKLEHDGVVYKTSPFDGRWDSGIQGFIYRHKEDVRNELGFSRLSKDTEEEVRQELKKEVELYSKWANGEVYQIAVYNEDGEDISEYSWDGIISINNKGEESIMTNHLEDILRENGYPKMKELLAKGSQADIQ